MLHITEEKWQDLHRRVEQLERQMDELMRARVNPHDWVHGITCPKVEHGTHEIYHHVDDHEKIYTDFDDNMVKCGRCHRVV